MPRFLRNPSHNPPRQGRLDQITYLKSDEGCCFKWWFSEIHTVVGALKDGSSWKTVGVGLAEGEREGALVVAVNIGKIVRFKTGLWVGGDGVGITAVGALEDDGGETEGGPTRGLDMSINKLMSRNQNSSPKLQYRTGQSTRTHTSC